MIEGLGEGWPVTNLGVTMKALGWESLDCVIKGELVVVLLKGW